jgi:tetratricopeptide (TPR) repeat protein
VRRATGIALVALASGTLLAGTLAPAGCTAPIEAELDTAAQEMRQGAYDSAVKVYVDVLERVPDAPNIHNNLGYALSQLGRYDEAIEHFEAAYEQGGPVPLQATLLHNWANTLEKLGRYDEADEKYALAAQADPSRADVFVNWGNVLTELKRPEDAADRYRQAVEINPESALGWFNLGNTLEGLDHPDEALACYRTFLGLKGNVPSNIVEHARRFVAAADAARPGGAKGST